jgi:hypothetical protein
MKNMKNKLIASVSMVATLVLLAGCTGTQQINPGNFAAALSQDNASDSFTGVTPYGQLSISRSVPNATDMTPVSPLTSAQISAITNDPIASIIYGFAHDPASIDASWSGAGGAFNFHRAMPPNALGTNNAVLDVTNTATADAVVTQTTTVKTK